jgi:single-strand DNA-binding protein
MPFVVVEMWEGRTVEQKRKLVRAITDAMVEHAGCKPDHLHVVIHDTPNRLPTNSLFVLLSCCGTRHHRERDNQMKQSITASGLVATTPRHLITQDGLPITSFRVACTRRTFDRIDKVWKEGDTNWYTVTAFRQLAINVATSINKGDRITFAGVLRVRDWDNGERSGTSVELEASAIGHDLTWGTSVFTRTVLAREPEPEDELV